MALAVDGASVKYDDRKKIQHQKITYPRSCEFNRYPFFCTETTKLITLTFFKTLKTAYLGLRSYTMIF